MKPNVFILVLDTVKRTEIQGVDEPDKELNFLENSLQKGTFFSNYIVAGGTTRISLNALFNGFYGSTSGLNYHHCEEEFSKTQALSLTEVFKFNGYRTFGATQGDISLMPWGFDRLWTRQEFFDLETLKSFIEEDHRPVFSYLHFYGVHDPAFGSPEHMTPANYRSLLNALSDEIEQLWQRLIREDDVVVVVSDHVCHLREKYDPNWRFFHEEEPTAGIFLSEATIRGICSIISPGRFPTCQVGDLVRSIDIFPTLCDSLGLEHPSVQGYSLWPALQGNEPWPELHAFVEGGGVRMANGQAICQSIRTPRWKFNRYQTHGEQFFDLKLDPEERENLVGRNHPQETIMRNLLAAQEEENRRGVNAFSSPAADLCRALRENRPPIPAISRGTRDFGFRGLFDNKVRGYLEHHVKSQIPRWRLKKERIVIYSASEHAHHFFSACEPKNMEMVVGLVDGNPNLAGSTFWGVPVYALTDFEDQAKPTMIIVAHHILAHDMYARIKDICRQPIRVYNLYHLDREIPLWWNREISGEGMQENLERAPCR